MVSKERTTHKGYSRVEGVVKSGFLTVEVVKRRGESSFSLEEATNEF
jgi:hypothetical protein